MTNYDCFHLYADNSHSCNLIYYYDKPRTYLRNYLLKTFILNYSKINLRGTLYILHFEALGINILTNFDIENGFECFNK